MTLEPGKLYQINRHFWFLFPTKEVADDRNTVHAARLVAVSMLATAVSWASYWSKELNCTVSFLDKGDTFMVVEVSDIQVRVINQDGKSGWISFPLDEAWARKSVGKVPNDT